jgi:hypothetical protein
MAEQYISTLLNHKRNEEILELHVTPLEDKLCTYRHKWFQRVHRKEDNRLPKQLMNYHPKGRRRPGRPLKRLLDDVTAQTETGHPGLNSWWNMMIKIVWIPARSREGIDLYRCSFIWYVVGNQFYNFLDLVWRGENMSLNCCHWRTYCSSSDDIWVWRTTVEWNWQGKTEELWEKSARVPLCPP